jgi:hypothetical protein
MIDIINIIATIILYEIVKNLILHTWYKIQNKK